MCPYCGNDSFQNSWGWGNARCAKCHKEFNVRFEGAEMVSEPLSESVASLEKSNARTNSDTRW